MIETLRRRRGHQFAPTKAIMRKLPKLYMTERVPAEDKIIWVHYFGAGSDHYVAELDPETFEAFGYVKYANYPGGEWGYFSLVELEQATHTVRLGSIEIEMVGVERNMHWTPCKFSEIKR